MASTAENTVAGEPRRYTSDELLDLRSSLPFVTCAIKNLNQHPDLACILRIPDRARKDPEHFSCTSRMLVEITNRSQQTDRRRVAESSSRESEYQSLPDALGNQESRQLQWALRKRESSDRSSQPHSAPTDTAAQHSENFQKFYRAVVSPTHVRVTAGGRIVPNTRATAPPLLEWNNDHSSFDPAKQASTPEANSAQSILSPNPQLNSGFAPLIPSTFLPPYNLLPQGNSLIMPNMPPQYSHTIPGSEHGSFDNGANPQVSVNAGGNLAQPGMIKLSHPAQFDGSRPFMINGQVVYPVNVGGPQLPFGMLGNQGYFPPSPMAPVGFMPQPFAVQIANMPDSMAFPPGHPAMLAAGMTPPSEGLPTMAPFMPMPGAILNSDLLKSQVAGFHQQLKNVEEQFANNNNIDPGFIGHQRVFLQSQINNLEAMIEHQRIQQAKEVNGSNDINGNNDNGTLGSATMSQNISKPSSTGVGPSAEVNRQAPAVVSSSMVTSKHEEKSGGLQVALNTERGKTRSEPGTKSRLSIAAAMAPPFQPRSQTLARQNNHANPPVVRSPTPDFIAELEANPKLRAELTARLMSKAQTNWTTPDQPYVTFSQGPPRQAPTKKFVQAPLQRSDTVNVHGSTNGATEDKFAMPATAVPYLVGTLPHGINATMAKANDFMYPRGLTDEEVRARYLYWGKAPRSVQSGLPKFDGKDFYPPSPVKSIAALATNGKAAGTITINQLTGAPMQNPNFDRLFLSPPKGSSKGYVTLGLVPAQQNFRNSTQTLTASQSKESTDMDDESNGSGGGENCRALTLRPCAPPSGGASSAGPVEQADRIKETIIYYNKAERESPVTPQNHGHSGEDAAEYDEVRTQDSWERDEAEARYNSNTSNYGPSQSVSDLGSSSTVDFDLGSQGRFASTEQRSANLKKAEQQTLFLQGMLKNEAPMVGSALSGTISSATAQGYLPPYRGSAAASFTPAVKSSQNPGFGIENMGSKHEGKHFAGPVPAMASSFLSENVPFKPERYPRPIIPPQNAEAYMRYLALKDNDDKQVGEQGWNANTTGTGPVNGSDW